MATINEKGRIDPHIDQNLPEHIQDDLQKNGADAKILAHSHDADEAMKAFQGMEGEVIEIDDATNKRLLRRIDWHLMPVSVVFLGTT